MTDTKTKLPGKFNVQCPRCGNKHDGLEVQPFKNGKSVKPNQPPYEQEYIGWATCPETQEPLFFPDPDVIRVPCPANQEQIRDFAYRLWELGGRKHGHDKEYWAIAEWYLRRWFIIPSIQVMARTWSYEVEKDLLEQGRKWAKEQMDNILLREIGLKWKDVEAVLITEAEEAPMESKTATVGVAVVEKLEKDEP